MPNVKSGEHSITLANPVIEFGGYGSAIIPNTKSVNKNTKASGLVKVYDHSGRVVATGSELSTLQAKLPNGVYYVRQGKSVKSSMVLMR